MVDRDNNTGKVLKVTRKTYEVSVNNEIVSCTVRGKITQDSSEHSAVKVGDNVKVALVAPGEGVIEEILPRQSQLSRSIQSRAYTEHIIAANIDQLLIILSTREPDFKSGLLDRYLVIAEKNNLQATICINKIDLDTPEKFQVYKDYYSRVGYPVLLCSALTGQGVDEVSSTLKSNVTALVGHSGVGKSSLIRAIEPGLDIRVGEVSQQTQKGRHTTTHVELFPLSNGGFVIDTPGIRELGFWDIFKHDLANYFIEIPRLADECQFADCLHLAEPGCAVKNAVEDGELLAERYENFKSIYDSLRAAHYEYAGRRTKKPRK